MTMMEKEEPFCLYDEDEKKINIDLPPSPAFTSCAARIRIHNRRCYACSTERISTEQMSFGAGRTNPHRGDGKDVIRCDQ
jgi:hypothetical protein